MKTSAQVRVKAFLLAKNQLKQYFDILRNTLIYILERDLYKKLDTTLISVW